MTNFGTLAKRSWVLFLLVCVSSVLHAQTSKFKIGVLAPLTGDVAPWGLDTQKALTLANEMLGKGRFEIIFEDDRCLGKEAATATNKLISVDHINFGMIVCTESTLASAPLFERNKVLVVAPGATAADISNAGDYIFRTWPSDAMMAHKLFEYVSTKGYKKIGAISELRGLPQEFSKVFLGLAQNNGIITIAENFQTTETDFRSILAKMKRESPDVLLISTDSARSALEMVKQLSVAKVTIPLISNFVAGSEDFYKNAGPAAEGLVFADTPQVSCADDSATCQVYQEFLRRYGEPTSTPFMVASTMAAFTVIEKAVSENNPTKEFLYNHSFETLLGTISFDKNGDVVGPKHALRIIKNGTPQLFE